MADTFAVAVGTDDGRCGDGGNQAHQHQHVHQLFWSQVQHQPVRKQSVFLGKRRVVNLYIILFRWITSIL